jgi:hypothetical protein
MAEASKVWSGFSNEDLEPILGTEVTDFGWRGITGDGEVVEVRGKNGVVPSVPESIMVYEANHPIGRREIRGEVVDVSAYLNHFSRSVVLHKANENEAALDASDMAIAIAPTLRARFNRAMVLLALGRWREGFEEFELCERRAPFLRPNSLAALLEAGIKPWRGESLCGKRLLVVHDHGLGDTLMMLRYIPTLWALGAREIRIMVPIELTRITAQLAPVTPRIVNSDYFVSFLHLLRWLDVEPDSALPTSGYVRIDPLLAAEWREIVGPSDRRRVGVAWSVGKFHDGDYPRALSLEELLSKIDVAGAEVHSVQIQGREEAESLGVIAHNFIDLADCAALMSTLDEIVSVDTAAIHLAGAIGHPDATVLLSKWHSWRWNGNPFYPDVRMKEI